MKRQLLGGKNLIPSNRARPRMAEEEVRQTYLESKAIEEYIQALRSRYQLLDASEVTLGNAKEALKSTSSSTEGQYLLVDVGGGVYIKATLGDTKNVLITVGEGVYLGKTSEEASKLLDERIESVRKAKEALLQEINRAQTQYTQRQTKLSELSQQLASKK